MGNAVRLSDFLRSPEWNGDWMNSGYLSERSRECAMRALRRIHDDIVSRARGGNDLYNPESFFIFNFIIPSEDGSGSLLISQIYTDENEKHESSSEVWSSSAFRLQIEIIDEVIYTERSRMYAGDGDTLVADGLSSILEHFNGPCDPCFSSERGKERVPLSEIVDMEPTEDLVLSLWRNIDDNDKDKFLDVGMWMLNLMSSLVKYAMGKDSPGRFDPKSTYLMFSVKSWCGKYIPRIGVIDMKTDAPLFVIIPYDLTDPVNPLRGIVASVENNLSRPIMKGNWTKIRAYFGWKGHDPEKR